MNWTSFKKDPKQKVWQLFCQEAYTREKRLKSRERQLLSKFKHVSLLKELLPLSLSNPHLSFSYDLTPLHRVGGDYLDFFWINTNQVAFYLFDIAGHDEELGKFSLNLKHTLAFYLPKLFATPEKVLTKLNKIITCESNDFLFVTMWCGCFNLKQRLLTFSSAGSPPALWLSEDLNTKALKSKSIPLGLDKRYTYKREMIQLEAKGTLYLMSDGAFEIELAESGHYLSWEGLKKLISRPDYLVEHKELEDPKVLKKLIIHLAKEQRLLDDFTLLKISLDLKDFN